MPERRITVPNRSAYEKVMLQLKAMGYREVVPQGQDVLYVDEPRQDGDPPAVTELTGRAWGSWILHAVLLVFSVQIWFAVHKALGSLPSWTVVAALVPNVLYALKSWYFPPRVVILYDPSSQGRPPHE